MYKDDEKSQRILNLIQNGELYVGKTFDNYKLLCDYIGARYETRASRKEITKKYLSNFFLFENKVGNTIKITKILKNDKEKTLKYLESVRHNTNILNGIYQEIELVFRFASDEMLKNYLKNYKFDGGGSTKRTFLKKLSKYYSYTVVDKQMYKIYVDNNETTSYIISDFAIDDKNRNEIGVYKIENKNDVYIGSTTSGFYQRYSQHKKGTSTSMLFTKELLDNGGKFECLWIADEHSTKQDIRDKEEDYINLYKNNKSYNVLNRKSASNKNKKKKFTLTFNNTDDYLRVLTFINDNNIEIYL